MRTFTLEGNQIVPGFPARQGPTWWYMDGITLNRECMPEIVDGRVVTASFSKPHYPAVDKPANLSWGEWERWLRETPSVGRSTTPVYTLRREKNPNDKAVLVMFEGGFRTEEGAEWPMTHHTKDWMSHEVKTSIVRMTPGMRLLLDSGRACLIYRHGADRPEYFTWRQWELEQAETLTSPMNVRCVTLEQIRARRGKLQQRCLPGITAVADSPFGAAIQLGTPEHPEWLPLFSGRCPAVLLSASIGLVAERRLQEYRYTDDPIGREYKSRSVPLYGFVPMSESNETTAYLVRVEDTHFHNSKTLRGEPVFIRWQDDRSYDGYTYPPCGAVAFILKEGEAISYRSRPQSEHSATTEPEFVLDVRDGELRITPYQEWRAADMNERPEEYLSAKWNPQATLPNIPSSWVGRQVKLNRSHIGGELMGVDGDAVLLRQDWSSGHPPRIERYEALWVTRGGRPIRKMPVEYQRQTFLKTRVNHAVFYDTTTMTDLLATDNNRQHEIRPVVIVELGVCEETGEVVCMYGAPSLEKGWGDRPWNVETKWCQTHHEAQQVRQTFIERVALSTDESEGEAIVRRLSYERDHPSRLAW